MPPTPQSKTSSRKEEKPEGKAILPSAQTTKGTASSSGGMDSPAALAAGPVQFYTGPQMLPIVMAELWKLTSVLRGFQYLCDHQGCFEAIIHKLKNVEGFAFRLICD